MNNPPAFYEKRKKDMKGVAPVKMTEEERLDQENQVCIFRSHAVNYLRLLRSNLMKYGAYYNELN